MTAGYKVKISVSLDADLVGLVDRRARVEGSTRSAVMERWLGQVSRTEKLARLEEETATYYDSLTAADRSEDAALAAASSTAARTLILDDPAAPGPARRPRRPSSRRRA